MTKKKQYSIEDRAMISFMLFFFLFFFFIPCAIYYSRFNVYVRSFFYFLAGSAALALCILSKMAASELAIILDRKRNSCRFGTYKTGKLHYEIINKPLDRLQNAAVRRRQEIETVSGPMGAPVKARVTSYRIFLRFEQEDEIAWDCWSHNLEQSHLIDLADKINQFLKDPGQSRLCIQRNLHKSSFVVLGIMALVFFVLIFAHR